ncbi:MAG: hypothetical protein V4697_03305 [Patescibacteria group bacterium]
MNILFLAIISVMVIVGVLQPIFSSYAAARSFVESKKAFLLSDSAVEEAVYRLKTNKVLGSSSSLTLSSSTATIGVVTTAIGKEITVTAPSNDYQRNLKISLALGTGVSFHYGIQSGQGGFVLNNSSSVRGNVFSSGSIVGSGNYIYGDVVSSGPTGLINGIHATGTAFAHTINNSTIDRDAYYMVKTSTTVSGVSHPNSADQADSELPISDEQIEEWEGYAALGGTATCTSGKYSITANATIGPIKIPCDLEIKGTGITVNIAGHIWVTGNISTQNSPTIKIDSSQGNQNVAIIADNPSNRLTSSKIDLGQNTTFQNSGAVGSFVFMISQNNSAETGGVVEAITVGQSSTALIAYAGHGLISLDQSVSLKEATAYKMVLNNSASITYDTGLASTLFEAGPGGGYDQIEWFEF